MAFCTNCGAKLMPQAKFCHVCGASIVSSENKSSTFSDGEYIPRFLICPQCQHVLEIKERYIDYHCPYCGNRIPLYSEPQGSSNNFSHNIHISEDVTQTRHNINEAALIRESNKAEENKRAWIALIVCAIILIAIPLAMQLGSYIEKYIAQSEGKINAGSYHDLIGENYETVESHFEAAGFTNIELIDLHDSGLIFWTDGTVKTISIGGNTEFESTDWFYPDTKVVISYH